MSVLGAINPQVGAAAVSGGSGLVGSFLGYLGQRSANKTNLKIARETNALQQQLVRETNAQQMANFQQQLSYNSPMEQRRMMEAAGYNPANLYGSGGNAVVSAPSAPNLQTAQLQRAEVSPYLGFSQDLAVMGQNLAAIANAKKEYEEGKKVELENSVFMQQMEYEFKRLGLANEWQELQNKITSDTLPEQINKIINEADFSLEKKNELHMRNALLEMFGQREYEAKIKDLEEAAKLKAEQGRTELTQQDLNRALGKKANSETTLAAVNAWYQKNIFPHVAKSLDSASWRDAWQGTMSQKSWEFMVKYGNQKEVISIFKDLKAAEFSHAAKEKAFKEIEKLQLDIDWKAFDEMCNGVQSIGSLTRGIPELLLLMGM